MPLQHTRCLRTLPVGLVLLATALLVTTPSAAIADADWLVSYEQALQQARETGKPVLADFTGSDWCGWCMRLKDEVFDTEPFQQWAAENVILLELDYPRHTPQPEELRQQNRRLLQHYNVGGYPTILFLDAEGTPIGRMGYMEGGPEPWIESAQRIVDAYRTSRMLQTTDDLAEAMAAARQADKYVLAVVAATPEQANHDRNTLCRSPQLIELASILLEIAHLEVPAGSSVSAGENPTVEVTSDDRFVLIDPASGEVLYHAGQSDAPGVEDLVSQIIASIPEIPYNGEWTEDLGRARIIALQQNKPLLLDFTGSDWCGWCVRLKDEVFDTEPFQQFAQENLVLVELDYPRHHPQPEEIRTRNRRLLNEYNVRGFPTLVILSPQGHEIGRMGYVRGGPRPFLRQLQETLPD